MEDTLGVAMSDKMMVVLLVLILVLMEDTLGVMLNTSLCLCTLS